MLLDAAATSVPTAAQTLSCARIDEGDSMRRKDLLALRILGLASATAAAGTAFTHHAGAAAPPQTPMPSASSFTARVNNQWFPLRPGTRYLYSGVKNGEPSRDVVTVTHQTKTIVGVTCVAVHDQLYLRGRLEERTTDWYSQDRKGDVWYFGENTAELDRHGHVTNTSGSWRAGIDGAKPGIYMPATPHVGQSGLQEYYKGQAEDHFKVVSLFGTVVGSKTRAGLLTEEWTPLEPRVLDHKMYVRGIGTVLEQTEQGGNERNELVSVTSGG
jgi:hypothetical protein